ncbi:dd-gdca protein [Anaeramoeba flamelloides]|uniref:Dd-gdca protein n=1 Tax=Anaeramoeba flamelloides TaxID=1746091 RepID=A0AAV8A015_9EUKA|nr:dd-gdca protein [Anaeramoeba flamelloides]
MKLVFLLLFFFFLSSLGVSTTPTSKTVEPESSCSNRIYRGLSDVCNRTQNIYCYDNLFCLNNKCERDNTGASCTQNTDCYGGLCVKGKCSGMKDCGDQCTDDIECWSGTCTGGICVGLQFEQACEPTKAYGRQCDKGLYCDSITSTCAQVIEGGKECYSHVKPNFIDAGVVCEASYICDIDLNNATSGKCVRKYSKAHGESCQSSLVCELGHGCQNNVCKKSPQTCDNANKLYCPSGSQCLCSSSEGEIESGLSATAGTCSDFVNYDCLYWNAMLLMCAQDNGCQDETNYVDGTCLYQNCFDYLEENECCKSINHNSTYYVNNNMKCKTCNLDISYSVAGEDCDESENKLCFDNLWCNSTNKCQKDNTGESCNQAIDCYGGLCVNGRCQISKLNGDECNFVEECKSGDCSKGYCKGKSEGTECDPMKTGGEDCDVGLFCDSATSKCIKSILPGKECTSHLEPYFMDWYNACTPGYICDYDDVSFTTGTCKLAFGGVEGDNCGSSLTCNMGLACIDMVCNSTYKKCDYSTKFCPYGQVCKCHDNHVSGVCIELANQECQDEVEELISCAQVYSCSIDEEFGKGTCLSLNCFDYVRRWECCLNRKHEDTYYVNNGIDCETCPTVMNYVGVGSTCGSGSNNYCYENLWCNEESKVCQKDNAGADCAKGSDCYGAICANGTCSSKKQAGDSCTVDDECWGNNCSQTLKKCIGAQYNEKCDPSVYYGHTCGEGLYCDSTKLTCQYQLFEGENCLAKIQPYYMEFDIVCRGGLICDYNQDLTLGICRALYSSTIGEDCGSSKICENGLACQDFQCTDTFSKCDENTLACPEGYVCECNTNKLDGSCKQVYNSDCQKSAISLLYCLQQYNCRIETDYVKGTCAYDNCFEKIQNLECCKQDGYETTYFLNNGMNCKKCSTIDTYVGLNEKCDFANNILCNRNLWCNSNTGKCEKDNTGTECTKGSECYGGICSKGKCSVMKANGDDCASDGECYSGNCNDQNVCRGLAHTAACDPSKIGGHQCDIALFCDSLTHTCIPQIQNGKECMSHLKPYFNDLSSACTAGSICDADDADYSSGKCRRVYSGSVGATCGQSRTCQSGFACQDNKCVSKFTKCDKHSKFCPEGYYCKCNTNDEDGKCVQYANTDCQVYIEELVDCIDMKGCSFDIDITIGTCIYDHCYDLVKEVECCKTGNGFQNSYYPNKGMECDQCDQKTYGVVGDDCDTMHDQECMKNLWCNSTNKCQADNTGEPCKQGSDCYGGVCANNVCTVMKAIDDQCQIAQECWSNSCLNKYCSGWAEDFPCDPSRIGGNICNKGFFCDSITEKCTKQILSGNECISHLEPYYQDYDNVCEYGYICDYNPSELQNGICRRLYSGQEGDVCGGSLTCELGYACVKNKCTKNFDVCDDKTNLCPQTHYCNCNSNQTQGTCVQFSNNKCQEQADALTNCFTVNQCSYPEVKGNGQCMYDRCRNELNDYQCCLKKGYSNSYFVNSGIDCNNCYQMYTYQAFNQQCDPENEILCYDNLWCNPNTGKCAKDNTGGKCSKGDECYGGLCVNGECSIRKDNGDSCSVNDECWNDNCQGGMCRGKTENSDCNPSNYYGSECDVGQFCDSLTNKCIPRIQPGKECLSHILPQLTDWRLVCSGGYYCDHVDQDFEKGYCKRYFSGKEGDTCGFSDTCELGLACQDNKCTSHYQKCDDVSKYCPWNSRCICNSDQIDGTCQQFANNYCQMEAEMLVDCSILNGCPYQTLTTKGSCLYEYCHSEIQYFECCLQENNYEGTFYPHSGLDCNLCPEHLEFAGVDEYCNEFRDVYCYDNLWCDYNDYKCKEDNTGGNCSYSIDCYGGVCANGICSGKLEAGDACVADTQCLTDKCTDGVCVGLPKGEKCDPTSLTLIKCEKGLFCDSITETCIEQIKPGKECYSHILPYLSEWAAVCSSGYICDNVDQNFEKGYCKRLYSGKDGDNCGFSFSCELGLACQNYECTSNFYSCDQTTKFCPEGGYCVCNDNEMAGYCAYHTNTDCQSQADEFINCQEKFGCGLLGERIEGSCTIENCFSQFSDFECCKQSGGYSRTYYLNKNVVCNTPTPTPTTGSDKIPDDNHNSIKLGVGMGIPICIALIAIAFFMWPKKKKQKKGNYEAL